MKEEIKLQMTCGCCPEQYDAYLRVDTDEYVKIGYIRLRWGHLTCEYQTPFLSVKVFEHTWEGDNYKGSFADFDERRHYLDECINALIKKHKEYERRS